MCVRQTQLELVGAYGPKIIRVPCRKCWACMKNKVNDLTGRALCEYSVSDWSAVLTLTYAPRAGQLRAEQIHKHDFQRFMKRFRRRLELDDKKNDRDGTTCRYITAGEYGSRKGRAHFHVLLFGKGFEPPFMYRKQKWTLDEWPHGFTYADHITGERAIRYVTKYLVKGVHDQNKGKVRGEEWVTYSRKPMLGAEFVAGLALRQAEMGVLPYNLNYLPPGAEPKNRYSLYGAAQRFYWDVLGQLRPDFLELRPGKLLEFVKPGTEWVDASRVRYLKEMAKREWAALDDHERMNILTSQLSVDSKTEDVSSVASRMRRMWADYDRREQWRDERADARRTGGHRPAR